MKARTKSALLLLATLVVGLLVGAVATGAILSNRVDQIRALRERGGFTERLEAVIQPTDEAQREAVRGVLGRSQARLGATRRAFYQTFRAEQDTMRAELAPLLTSDQQARLDEWFARDHRLRRRRSPGPDRRPPAERREPGGRPAP